MDTPTSRFILKCDASRSMFKLYRDGEFLSSEFESLDAALEFAASIARQETPISVMNELGQVFTESTVRPVSSG
jgi:hypothetical protein